MKTIKEGYLYDPVAKKERKATPEEYVRQELLRILVSEYDYSFENMETEFPIKIGSDKKRADIAIFNPGETHVQEHIYIIIETKSAKIKINDKSEGVGQLISYVAASPACKYGLWTNGPGFLRQVVERDIHTGRVEETIADIPRYGQERSNEEKPLLDDLLPATSESLKWRFKKCHDIISTSGDDKMTAFWELLKIIETKIEDEREDKEFADFYATNSEIRTQDGIAKVYARINGLYKRLIVDKYDKYKGIFGDSISIRPAAMARIVSEMQNYSLLETEASVKGAAYEEIVGANLRGDKGEFFTPRVVIDAAVRMLEIEPEDICTDLACGSGGFVISMLEAGKKAIKEKYGKRKGNFQSTIEKDINDFSSDNIIANDINRNLANACEMNFVMNGVKDPKVFNQDILEPVNNWDCENYSQLKKMYGLRKKRVGNKDFIIGNITKIGANPPFGNNITRTEEYVLKQYDLAKDKTSQIVELLFLERIVQLLVPGKGKAAIVIPQSILNNPGLDYVRKWLFANTKVLSVLELPVETFLISGREGTGTLTAILVVQRRELEDTVNILNGLKQIENYPIFMSVVNKVGYDRRGNQIFLRDEDGQEITEEETITSKNTVAKIEKKIVDNDLPGIVDQYLEFSRKLKENKIYYDEAEEIYRAL